MKRLFLTLLLVLATAGLVIGAPLDGTYRIEMSRLFADSEAKPFPGVQPWEEKIEIDGSRLRYHTGSRGPLVMNFEVRGDFLLAAYKDEEGEHCFPIYREPKGGSLHLAGKRFKKTAEPGATDNPVSAPRI